MLGADGLNLVIMVAESGIIDSAAHDLVVRSQALVVSKNRTLQASVSSQIAVWRSGIKRKVVKACKTDQFEQELNLYQEVIHYDEATFFELLG